MSLAKNSTPSVPSPSVDWAVFLPAVFVVIVAALPLMIYPETAASLIGSARTSITQNFLWLYLWVGIAAFVFCAWLAFGPYAHVKLGAADEEPEYSNVHWVAMMFTAAIGASVFAWGFAEPIYYLQTPPMNIERGSSQAFEWAHMYPLIHWGFVPWAIYVVPSVPIAYMLYVRKSPTLRISSACDGALPKRGREHIKTSLDVLIVLGIVGGVTTGLGLGVPLLSAMFATLFGSEDTLLVKMGVLIMFTVLFGSSVYRGLKKGIKLLADINMVLGVIVLLFILLAGPTVFILNLTTNSIGLVLDNFLAAISWTDPIEQGDFPRDWTGFYWAWWVAYTGMVGLFFGRISRGRTIRQLVLGVIGWGTLGTWLCLAITGAYSIYLEHSGVLSMTSILSEQGMSYVNALAIESLPLGKVTLAVFCVLSVIFYATTFDSSAYVLASICAKNLPNDAEPKRWSRVSWAILLAFLTAGILQSGALDTVLSATVVSSLPLIPVLVLLSISLVRWLREDFAYLRSQPSHTKKQIK